MVARYVRSGFSLSLQHLFLLFVSFILSVSPFCSLLFVCHVAAFVNRGEFLGRVFGESFRGEFSGRVFGEGFSGEFLGRVFGESVHWFGGRVPGNFELCRPGVTRSTPPLTYHRAGLCKVGPQSLHFSHRQLSTPPKAATTCASRPQAKGERQRTLRPG